MNDERPIEKQLRRYAERRRAEAGTPLELHPATRRLLQGEVARRYGKATTGATRSASAWRGILQNLWPRLVWAVPVLLVMFFGVWMWRQADEGSEPQQPGGPASLAKLSRAETPREPVGGVASRELASASVPQAYPPAALGESTFARSADDQAQSPMLRMTTRQDAGLPAPTATPATVEADRATLATADKSKSDLPAGGSLAFAPLPEESGRALTFYADSATATRERAATATGTFAKVTPLARGGGLAGEESRHIQRARFSQTFANVMPELQTPAQAKVAEVVLANFQVEQSGAEVRVVDSDGSTYTGGPIGADAEVAAPKDTAGTLSASSFGQFKAADSLAQPARAPAAAAPTSQVAVEPGTVFRVAGTNRTLNQQVVFLWNFVDPSNAVAAARMNTVSNERQLLEPKVSQQFPALLQNSGISGRAQLNGGAEIYINAVPVEK